MSPFFRYVGIFALSLSACRPCDDECREFIALSFFSADATGAFTSTRYTVVIDAEGQAATCTIDVDAVLDAPTPCQGDASITISDGAATGDTTSGDAGARLRILVRWDFAPSNFNVVVRDAANVLVLNNTLTPAYQDQDVDACDGECRHFARDITLDG